MQIVCILGTTTTNVVLKYTDMANFLALSLVALKAEVQLLTRISTFQFSP